MEKTCRGCKEKKLISDFYKHPQMPDGHLNFCKECVRERVSRRWYANAEKLRISERARHQRRRADPNYVEQREKYYKAWRTPEKRKAHCAVARKLKRPSVCQICWKECEPHGHHEDHKRPLDVVWCCTPCHRQITLGNIRIEVQ
jgi:hypothetical protein